MRLVLSHHRSAEKQPLLVSMVATKFMFIVKGLFGSYKLQWAFNSINSWFVQH